MAPAAAECLESWLAPAPAEARDWLAAECGRIAGGDERALLIAFGLAPRKLGRADLGLDHDALARGRELGVDARRWTTDQAARARLVLALPSGDAERWLATLDRLFAAAGLEELVALYQALPLLPHPERLAARAAEGIRSNMRAVFEAVALDNALPAERLDEQAWNQMVLKCIFVGSTLARVVGLDRRANPRLTRMLCDYAHERWAAKRAISPELWRPVGRCCDAGALDDLARVLAGGSDLERRAATLALHDCGSAEAQERLAKAPDLARAAATRELTWDGIAAALP